VGRTPAMQALYRLVARVMNTELPVLITGEAGTGKSLIARAIHDFSDRRTLPFVVVRPATWPMDGPSAVIARAKGGSILFDEVGDLGEAAQGGSCGCSTPWAITRRASWPPPRDLADKMEAGELRQDLFYRLGGVVDVPPARAGG
jgi:two-component system nitrogen regulation response regulator GlnG